MAICNTTLTIHEDPLWHGFTFHHFGLILSAVFALISVIVSFLLIFRHATHYLRPDEQRHIIRILFMIPIYSTVSFLSYLFYRHAVYFEVARDCYEAFAIASFFALLCHYIAPSLHEQKDWFRKLKPRPWVLPLSWFRRCCGGERGMWRTPRSGLTWFNIIWLGVFQYCFIRVFFTLVSVVSQAFGRYCESSLNPAFAHIWVMVFEGSAVTIAMYCIIQFYIQVSADIAEHKPFMKILCIKLVIFFSFWQTLIISFLSSSGALKTSKHLASPDIKVGIPSMLLCIEMAIFSILHLFAFPYKPYTIPANPELATGSGYSGGTPRYVGGPMGVKAIVDAFNPWDLVKAVGRGVKWVFVGRRKRLADISYKDSISGPSALGGDPMDPSTMGTTYGGPLSANKPSRYQPLDEEEDEQLLAHAGPNPISNAPGAYASPYGYTAPSNLSVGVADVDGPAGEIGDQRWGSSLTTGGAATAGGGLHDTEYHGGGGGGAVSQYPPQIPYPSGQQGVEGEWDVWGGAQPGVTATGHGGLPPQPQQPPQPPSGRGGPRHGYEGGAF
ncbi:MAG: hypothetical protein M1819_004017 [Sarea resinae]|nr:MAG: hypothetical protein M1819_004017 [Sarea resinae]